MQTKSKRTRRCIYFQQALFSDQKIKKSHRGQVFGYREGVILPVKRTERLGGAGAGALSLRISQRKLRLPEDSFVNLFVYWIVLDYVCPLSSWGCCSTVASVIYHVLQEWAHANYQYMIDIFIVVSHISQLLRNCIVSLETSETVLYREIHHTRNLISLHIPAPLLCSNLVGMKKF